MNRPQRQRAQVERLRPNNQPLQPRRQQAQPAQRQPKQPRRTLDITLTRVEQDKYDTSDPDSEFYTKYFDNPNDNITKRLDDLDYSNQKFNTIALQSGITNYELKDINTIQLKPVSFAKFKAGDYETGKSKSDSEHYEQKIRGFTTKYQVFKDYKGVDDLTWIVRKNRLLMCEILEKYIPMNRAAATIEADIVAMMRIMYLALGSKQHPLYIKYAYIIKDIKKDIKSGEAQNTFNETELARGGYIPWDIVLSKQKELYDRFNRIANKKSKDGYALNQDLLLLSLYCLIPPLRNEPKTLLFTTQDHNEGDWIYMKDDNTIVLDLNEEKKKHDPIELKLPVTLQNIIRQSYTLYPRLCAFTDTRYYPNKMDEPAALTTMNNRLEKLFEGYKNQEGVQYKVGASMLRSSYVNYRYNSINRHLKWAEKEDIAKKMRTSIEMMELQYLKILTEPMNAIPIPEATDQVIRGVARPVVAQIRPGQPIPVRRGIPVEQPVMIVKRGTRQDDQEDDGAYARHVDSAKKYYRKNREKILNKQKAYRKTPEHRRADARRKIIALLNKDEEYSKRIQQKTVDKYNIKMVDGIYV